MNANSKEIESSSTKHDDQGISSSHESIKIPKSVTNPASSSTAPWLRPKDPRIVRVSRALGGKDRHSKVCTIRGLRDRRVRLSVPTAIQLYDLQDRLGLNQPSKAVDWLLNAAKDEIDELPPLPIGPENFALTTAHQHQPIHDYHELTAGSSKGIARKKESNEGGVHDDDDDGRDRDQQIAVFPPREGVLNRAFITGFLNSSSSNNNNAIPSYGSFYPLEPSSFSNLSQAHHIQNLNALPLPSTLSLSSGVGGGSHQNLVTQPYFINSGEPDPRQINHQVMMTPSIAPHPHGVYSLRQSMRPFHFSVSPRFNLHSSPGNNLPRDEFHSK